MILESLLISHDAALLGVLRPTLEKMSVSVEVCSSSETGNDTLGKRKFDAIIVDCDDLQGGVAVLGSLRRARSNRSSVAFAVLNGKTTTQEAFQVGANFVLQKPLTPLHATRCFNAALSFMIRERRRYFRHPVEMQVRICIANSPEVIATTTNLSEGGMALRFTGKLPTDSEARLHFALPGSNTSLELQAKIAWADETGHAGMKFADVPQSSQYQLEKWLTDHLRIDMPGSLKGFVDLQ
jgi:CheY-like chemotaxis protein